MKRALLLAAAAALLLAACGGDDSDDETTTMARETSTVPVYFLRDGKVMPVARSFIDDQELTEQALSYLVAGPGTQEKADLGVSNAVSSALPSATVSANMGAVRIDVDGTELPVDALAQLVYTLSGLEGVTSVVIDGKSYSRADFEEQTPSVLVESPLPFEEVTSPITITGTANTFEANFQYELLDADGNVLDENFVTATSGTGTRGTFKFTTADVDDVTALVVYESSAEDGSRMREVEIPLNSAA